MEGSQGSALNHCLHKKVRTMGQVPQKDFQCRVLLNSKPTELASRWKIRAVDSVAYCHCREYFAFSHEGKNPYDGIARYPRLRKEHTKCLIFASNLVPRRRPLALAACLTHFKSESSSVSSLHAFLRDASSLPLPRLLTAHDSFGLPSHGLGLFRRGLLGDWLALARLA